MKKSDIETPIESPIPFRVGSNGEIMPRLPSRADRVAEELFHRLVGEKSRRLGLTRRAFVQSAMGHATALLVVNQVYGCSSSKGFQVDPPMMEDAGAACEALTGDEFIFDVQTHHVNPAGSWRDTTGFANSLRAFPFSRCGEPDFVDCFDADHYIRELFVNSDTSVAVLSQVPAVPGNSPLENEEAVTTREIVNRLADSPRLFTHGIVLPDRGPEQLDGMQSLVEQHDIAAWKVYTQFGLWRLDDSATGIPFIEKARELGVRTICAHKGLPIFGLSQEFASPADIGVAAKMFPDVNFLVYHSAVDLSVREGPFQPNATRGVDSLVRAVQDNDLAPGANVYAELGSSWQWLMNDPVQAGHMLGKLLLAVGEDRVLWGTDSIWYGSPQAQITGFRAFQIPEELQERHGYPALTDSIKRKILGLNAAAAYGFDPAARLCAISEDDIANKKRAIADDPTLQKPTMRAMGPQTRREFFRFLALHDGQPL